MPGPELNELSAAIGELREATRQSKEDRDRLERKIDKIADAVFKVRSDFEATKNRGLGLIAGVAMVSSVIGAKVAPFFERMLPAIFIVAVLVGVPSRTL